MVGALILAAGNSSRMKTLKPFLQLETGQSFLETIVNTYSSWGVGKIVVVVSREVEKQCRDIASSVENVMLVPNDNPGFERFYSVKLGLKELTEFRHCFLQNVDNPFISGDILDELYQMRSETAFVSPSFMNKGGHPVLLNQLQVHEISAFPQPDANLKTVLNSYPSVRVEMRDDRTLINMNDEEDYQRYLKSSTL